MLETGDIQRGISWSCRAPAAERGAADSVVRRSQEACLAAGDAQPAQGAQWPLTLLSSEPAPLLRRSERILPLLCVRAQAFRVACHYGDSEAELEETLGAVSGAVFNRLLIFMLREVGAPAPPAILVPV